MDSIFRRGFREYKRQVTLKKFLATRTAKVKAILNSFDKSISVESPAGNESCERSLLMLMPLVEIAWADGRVTRSEMDAILRVADTYGLVKNATGYRELMELLLSRPAPPTIGQMWNDFGCFLKHLPERDRQTIASGVLAQAQFVADQSSNSVIGFLRGERIRKDEKEALRMVVDQLEKAKAAAAADTEKAAAAAAEKEKSRMMVERLSGAAGIGKNHPGSPRDRDDRLIPLVPLVKIAWAEGRVTKRERLLIFEAATRMGIAAGTADHNRLCDWLKLHPTDEFYVDSLERLKADWGDLSEEERILRRLDLLSDCVNIAEASGGTSRYPAGGARVCDEELAAVKHIAVTLNKPSAPLAA